MKCAQHYMTLAPGSSLGSVDGDVTCTLRPVLMFLHSLLKDKHFVFCDECCILVLLMYVTLVVLVPIYCCSTGGACKGRGFDSHTNKM